MFKSFFLSRRWLPWSVLVTFVILFGTCYRVQLDVKINEWFGTFYDLLMEPPASIYDLIGWEIRTKCIHVIGPDPNEVRS